jgi:hypothetical protein
MGIKTVRIMFDHNLAAKVEIVALLREEVLVEMILWCRLGGSGRRRSRVIEPCKRSIK